MSASTEKFLIGIDEAGRGPLAGPVVVGAVKWRAGTEKIFKGIRDSKKLTPKMREEWFLRLTSNPDIEWAAAKIYPATIDKINIYQATLLGVKRVYNKLNKGLQLEALLDGSLNLPRSVSQKTIIKGDEKIPIISAASIIAKVTRDRLMIRLHKKYPQYGFDVHKGYATRMHRGLVKASGLSPVHRQSFAKNIELW